MNEITEVTTETRNQIMAWVEMLKEGCRPKFKLKICTCTMPQIPKFCEVIELPFKPQEGDFILVPIGDSDQKALTIRVHGLVYELDKGYFSMRPDTVTRINNQSTKESVLDDKPIDPMEL